MANFGISQNAHNYMNAIFHFLSNINLHCTHFLFYSQQKGKGKKKGLGLDDIKKKVQEVSGPLALKMSNSTGIHLSVLSNKQHRFTKRGHAYQ